MIYHITYGEFQQHLKDYYHRTGNHLQFSEMIDYLHKKGCLKDTLISQVADSFYDDMSDEDFNLIIDQLVLNVTPTEGAPLAKTVTESDIIPIDRDVFIIRHPRYTRPQKHTHNFFEIDYVASGQCSFYFEDTMRVMKAGELCLIAPSSVHDMLVEDDSTVFTILIRKSTFDTTFFSLLSRNDLLSIFFRNILQNDSRANYLLFFAKDNIWLKRIVRNMIGECNRTDNYSNSSCISWVNLLFSTLLRNYSQTLQHYDGQYNNDFSLVLQYIQHNFQTLTLSSLAELFHYSEPHLCTLIKQNTGYTFTELIRRLRLSDAVNYLENTNLKINEIAEAVGYNSADHFSRVFRSTYKMSPLEYRKQNAKNPSGLSFFGKQIFDK